MAETFGIDTTDRNTRSMQVSVLVTEDVSSRGDFKQLLTPVFIALYQELHEVYSDRCVDILNRDGRCKN